MFLKEATTPGGSALKCPPQPAQPYTPGSSLCSFFISLFDTTQFDPSQCFCGSLTCCLSLCHSFRVKVFQLGGTVNGWFNQFIAEALFMHRTTGSTEELQRSHMLQLTRCYSFLQVLWPFWYRMLMQFSPHTASLHYRSGSFWSWIYLGKTGLLAKVRAGRHFPVNCFPIFS